MAKPVPFRSGAIRSRQHSLRAVKASGYVLWATGGQGALTVGPRVNMAGSLGKSWSSCQVGSRGETDLSESVWRARTSELEGREFGGISRLVGSARLVAFHAELLRLGSVTRIKMWPTELTGFRVESQR